MAITVGDLLPAGSVSEGTPANKLDPAELFKSGRHVIFGVPGAFTPTCSNVHLPGYVTDYDAIRGKGIASISCISVNDAYVMAAWGSAHNAGGKVRMLADASGAYTKALGLDVQSAGLGGTRCKRFVMVVSDGRVERIDVEPDSFGASCSLAPSLLSTL